MTETALARLEDFNVRDYNVLTPVIHVNRDAPAASEYLVEDVAVVTISPDHDTYKPFFAKDGEIALNARGLNKLAAAAGLEIISLDVEERTRRPDGHVYVRMRAEVAVRQSNGEYLRRITHKDIDTQDELETFLRQQQKKARGKSKPEADRILAAATQIAQDQMLQLRQFLLPNAETKCLNRAIRSVLNLKQTYAKAEIARPFVVPRLLARPDLTAPAIAERSRAGITSVYGPAAELEAGKPGGNAEADSGTSADEPVPARHNVRPDPGVHRPANGAGSGEPPDGAPNVETAVGEPAVSGSAAINGEPERPSPDNVEDRPPTSQGKVGEAAGPPDQSKTHQPRGSRSTRSDAPPPASPENSGPSGRTDPETASASLPEPCPVFTGSGVDMAPCERVVDGVVCGWPRSSHNRHGTP